MGTRRWLFHTPTHTAYNGGWHKKIIIKIKIKFDPQLLMLRSEQVIGIAVLKFTCSILINIHCLLFEESH